MSDAPAAPVAAAPKAKKAAKPKAKPTHPTTAVMVAAAITALKDKKGSSRPAIKKYIAANYKVDIVKLGPHLKKASKAGVKKKRPLLEGIFSPCHQELRRATTLL